MYYYMFFEFCSDDLEVVLEKNMRLAEEKETDKNQKYMIPLQHTGQGNCFTIIETTNLEQFKNTLKSRFPEIKAHYAQCKGIPRWVKQFMKSK